jgi:hypothetical protein
MLAWPFAQSFFKPDHLQAGASLGCAFRACVTHQQTS